MGEKLTVDRVDVGYDRSSREKIPKLNNSIQMVAGRKLATQAGRRQDKQAYDQMYLMNTLYATYKEPGQGTKSQHNATRATPLRGSTRKLIPNSKCVKQVRASDKKIWERGQLQSSMTALNNSK